jgi:hypothetical protein
MSCLILSFVPSAELTELPWSLFGALHACLLGLRYVVRGSDRSSYTLQIVPGPCPATLCLPACPLCQSSLKCPPVYSSWLLGNVLLAR